jgi:hypothetical protein
MTARNGRPPIVTNFSHRAHHAHQFRGKLHMAKQKAKIATRVSFRVRRDGLYRLINRGRWRRVARRSTTLQLRFRLGRLVIEQGAGKSADDDGVSRAVDQVLKRLFELDGIVEVRRTRRSVQVAVDLDSAAGFLISVPGIGPTLVVKPVALRHWVHGAVPFRRVLAGLDAKGQLIRGADGKTTRQVVIPGLGRRRYYCFKTTRTLAMADRRHSECVRLPARLRSGSAMSPTPLFDSAIDDDWGPVTTTAPADRAASHQIDPATADGPTSPAVRNRERRVLGTVATWRGLRRINGG